VRDRDLQPPAVVDAGDDSLDRAVYSLRVSRVRNIAGDLYLQALEKGDPDIGRALAEAEPQGFTRVIASTRPVRGRLAFGYPT
jgi:hypothetical protein